jgi:hypothetical protein
VIFFIIACLNLKIKMNLLRHYYAMQTSQAKPWAEHFPTRKQPAELVGAMNWLPMKTLYAQPIALPHSLEVIRAALSTASFFFFEG